MTKNTTNKLSFIFSLWFIALCIRVATYGIGITSSMSFILVTLNIYTPLISVFKNRFSRAQTMMFVVLSILAFDIITAQLSYFSLANACIYGLVELVCVHYLSKRYSLMNVLTHTVCSILLFDAVTGLGVGPFLFQQSFVEALVGQIPFTTQSLLKNLVFTGALYTGVHALNILPFRSWVKNSERRIWN